MSNNHVHQAVEKETAILFPTLVTERLTLRPLSMDDQQSIFALRADPEVNKYLGRQASKTVEDAVNFIESILKNNLLYWAVTITNSGDFAGTICLFDFSNEKNKCEIGYELLPGFQGRGIMKEALEKVIEHAFQSIQIESIDAFTHIDNQSSVKLLEKTGFQQLAGVGQENSKLCIFTLTKV